MVEREGQVMGKVVEREGQVVERERGRQMGPVHGIIVQLLSPWTVLIFRHASQSSIHLAFTWRDGLEDVNCIMREAVG